MRETDIVLSLGGFPPLSARNCQQTLEPIKRGHLKRTIKGDLVYLGRDTHHKYQSVIKCEDKEAPVLENVWKGQDVHVACIQRLWQRAYDTTVILDRLPRERSIIVLSNHEPILPQHLEGSTITLPHADECIVGYQPLLNMKLVDFHLYYNEWHETGGWPLNLVEV